MHSLWGSINWVSFPWSDPVVLCTSLLFYNTDHPILSPKASARQRLTNCLPRRPSWFLSASPRPRRFTRNARTSSRSPRGRRSWTSCSAEELKLVLSQRWKACALHHFVDTQFARKRDTFVDGTVSWQTSLDKLVIGRLFIESYGVYFSNTGFMRLRDIHHEFYQIPGFTRW